MMYSLKRVFRWHFLGRIRRTPGRPCGETFGRYHSRRCFANERWICRFGNIDRIKQASMDSYHVRGMTSSAFSSSMADVASVCSSDPEVEPQNLYLQSWPGLKAWRTSGCNERRIWGPGKLGEPINAKKFSDDMMLTSTNKSTKRNEDMWREEMASTRVVNLECQGLDVSSKHAVAGSLAEYGKLVLTTSDPYEKARLTHVGWRAFLSNIHNMPVGHVEAPSVPARPAKPELVSPREIPSMKKTTLPLNVYMLHNLAHVELNAIDLAWDTVVRFSWMELPVQFYADFARVADDESRHLFWCLQRLEELGFEYGCMPSHNLLWEGCDASSGHIASRLAIVPMGQEARGLDAGGRISERLVGLGDNRTSSIVARIAEEEKAHVAVGVSWFKALCATVDAEPGEHFTKEITDLCPDLLRPPFHHAAREEVGLVRSWYDASISSDLDRKKEPCGEGGNKNLKSMRVDELRDRLMSLLQDELEITRHG